MTEDQARPVTIAVNAQLDVAAAKAVTEKQLTALAKALEPSVICWLREANVVAAQVQTTILVSGPGATQATVIGMSTPSRQVNPQEECADKRDRTT